MNRTVRITVLVENTVHRPHLVAEHGLSIHIQIGERCVLFDTGQTDKLVANARALGVDLTQLDAIVLSHGHYDHTGGVAAVLKLAPTARVFVHPAALEPKYGKSSSDQSRFIGMSPEAIQAVRGATGGFVGTPGWTDVGKGLFVTGEIPRITPYEDTGGPFFLDAACTRPDPLIDDQALVIDLGPNLLLLSGCAHSGVVNTLDHVARMTARKPVRAVIGGLHLGSATQDRVQQTISRLRGIDLDCLAPVHCTGWPATAQLWQTFPEIHRQVGVGTTIEFD